MSTKEIKFDHYLGKILSDLMIECDIDDAKLSREIRIPASTISRIRLSQNANPTAATLRPIAKFFNLSISQLLGDETLPKDRLPGTHSRSGFTTARMPVLEWDWVINWIENRDLAFKSKLNNWISTEKEVSTLAYALSINTESYGVALRKGSVIIVDPHKKPRDGDLVLLNINDEKNILLKQVLKDGRDVYIRSVNPEMKGTKLLGEHYKYLGMIIEIRFDLSETTKYTLHCESPLKIIHNQHTKLQET